MRYYVSYGDVKRVLAVHFDRPSVVSAATRLVKEHVLSDDWGMHTDRGNRRVGELAQRFVTQLAYGVKPRHVARTFFHSFARLYKTKTMFEAADTAVRGAVWEFALKFKDLLPGGEVELEGLWEVANA